MEILLQRNQKRGLTLVNVLLVIGSIVGLAMLFLPSLANKNRRSPRLGCINNLKQIGIGFRLYANDNDGKYPFPNSTNEAWKYYQASGTKISSPKVLICPVDAARFKKKTLPTDFEDPFTTNSFAHPNFRNQSLSYFYGIEVDGTKPDMLLAGDRNLSWSDKMISGILILKTNTLVSWTPDIHKTGGNIALADGSAQQVTIQKLRQQIHLSTNETQRLILP